MKNSIPAQAWFLVLFATLLFGVAKTSWAQEPKEQYRIKVGDIVQIEVVGEDELTMGVPVNETGAFIYPLIGEIELLDKTIVDIQTVITDGLRGDYLVDPKVNVNVELAETINQVLAAELLPEGVYINGEVARSGQFPYKDGLTISKAIVLAGGFTERAARNKITVVTNEGEQKPKRVKLDYILKPGDIVTVPRRFF